MSSEAIEAPPTEAPTEGNPPDAVGGDEDSSTADSGDKVMVFFKATGAAPIMKRNKFKVASTNQFSFIIDVLRRSLRIKPGDAIFCYVNDWFQPAPDETLSNLTQSFGIKGTLTIRYCLQPAWG